MKVILKDNILLKKFIYKNSSIIYYKNSFLYIFFISDNKEIAIKFTDYTFFNNKIDFLSDFIFFLFINHNSETIICVNKIANSELISYELNLNREVDFDDIEIKSLKNNFICFYYNKILFFDINLLELVKETYINGNIISTHPNEDIFILCNFFEKRLSIKAININNNKFISEIDYPFDYVEKGKFSPDGKYLALIVPDTINDPFVKDYGDPMSLLRVYDFEKNEFLYELGYKFKQFPCNHYKMEEVYFTSDSKYGIAFISSPKNLLIIFDVATGEVISLRENISSSTYDTESDMMAYILKEEENVVNIESFQEFLQQ